MFACLHAPNATASSGLTDWEIGRLNAFSTASLIIGIRVEPPTNKNVSISSIVFFALEIASLILSIVLSTKDLVNCSNLARVIVIDKFNGLLSFIEIYGKLISVCDKFESSTFAFSAASITRDNAIPSFLRSTPSLLINSSIM